MYAYYFRSQMRTVVVVAVTVVAMAILMSIVVTHAVRTISAITDNNTEERTRGVGNDSSIIEPGSSGKDESAKSGINTTVCGPDAAHACQTSSGG